MGIALQIERPSSPANSTIIRTDRLELVPMSLAHVEAVMRGQRDVLARLLDATLPVGWPSRDSVLRAYGNIDRIRADPDGRLWGDHIVVALEGGRRVVGSVVFFGHPDADGAVEIAYGIEPGSQGRGYASEATQACVTWALSQREVRTVMATTTPFAAASARVLQKLGMQRVGTRDHEILGQLTVWSVSR